MGPDIFQMTFAKTIITFSGFPIAFWYTEDRFAKKPAGMLTSLTLVNISRAGILVELSDVRVCKTKWKFQTMVNGESEWKMK